MKDRIGFYELLACICVGLLLALTAYGFSPSALLAVAASALTFAVLHAGDRRW